MEGSASSWQSSDGDWSYQSTTICPVAHRGIDGGGWYCINHLTSPPPSIIACRVSINHYMNANGGDPINQHQRRGGINQYAAVAFTPIPPIPTVANPWESGKLTAVIN